MSALGPAELAAFAAGMRAVADADGRADPEERALIARIDALVPAGTAACEPLPSAFHDAFLDALVTTAYAHAALAGPEAAAIAAEAERHAIGPERVEAAIARGRARFQAEVLRSL